jgi:phage terminase large subunit-like protein
VTAAEDREADHREQALAVFNRICPGVVDNPYIPHWPLPQQALFLGSHQTWGKPGVYEALYGGAAGGGKSDALLMGAAQYVHDPDYAGILFRKTHTDLAQPGALMDRALEWWKPRGVAWDGTNKIFRFPSGAQVALAYLGNDTDRLRYQGSEYQYTAWDELSQWSTLVPYLYVGRSRVRRKTGSAIPLRTLSASNPGGPGHNWVKRRFIGGYDPESNKHVEPLYPYFPARIADNPFLDQATYIEGLMGLHPTVRAQLLEGDWSAREKGDYFRSEWFGPLLDPHVDCWPSSGVVRVRWWDLAASEKEDAAFTSGVLMARSIFGVRAIEHVRSFRATPGRRDDLIAQQAQLDGFGVFVGLEIEGGSGGPAQFETLSRRLRAMGYRVVGARPRVGGPGQSDQDKRYLTPHIAADRGKAGRADPVASCLERGHQRRGECPDTGAPWWGEDIGRKSHEARDGLRLFAGSWTQGYLDVVEGFPDGPTCDEVDATSGAWAWLEAHGPGAVRPPAVPEDKPAASEIASVHPEDRRQDELDNYNPDRELRLRRGSTPNLTD